jgi:hypothetical protein
MISSEISIISLALKKCKSPIISKLLRDKKIKDILKKDFEMDVKYDGKKITICGE